MPERTEKISLRQHQQYQQCWQYTQQHHASAMLAFFLATTIGNPQRQKAGLACATLSFPTFPA
jgi:hypothetical protein